MTTLLSYGLGVDSTAILLNWLENPKSRKYIKRTLVGGGPKPKFRKIGTGKVDLSDLTVITAMTGDEFPDLKRLVETHVLPRFREHGIRYVQVARASMKDKLTVLEDTREPHTLHLEGAFKLSDELLLNGTVPQYRKGSRRCSLKYKGDPLDMWIKGFVGDSPFVHALGFDARETGRATTDLSYSRSNRWLPRQKTSIYPLFDWEWPREMCQQFIMDITGEEWPKSACAYCPFTMGEDLVMTRFSEYPEDAAKSLFIEYVSMALNHRQSLYPKGRTLFAAVNGLGMEGIIKRFHDMLSDTVWGLYWVRRIYYAPSKAFRSIRLISEGSWSEMQEEELPTYGEISLEGGIPRVIMIPRIEKQYPVLEEVIVAAPRTVEPKETPKEGYDENWQMALQGDWSFLHERYRPEVEEEDEEEEEEHESEAPALGQRIMTAREIPEFIEHDGRKDEERWLCEMADILKTPYTPECPR